MFLCFLWLLTAWAAPIPVVLPEGEDPARWTEALELADLQVGAPGEGAGIWIAADGPVWRVRVRGTEGEEHRVTADRPTTEAEREALAHWVASLARPVPALALPTLETVVPAPAPRPAPKPEPVVAADPEEPAPAAAEPDTVAEPDTDAVADAGPPEPGPDEAITEAVALEDPADPGPSPWAAEGWLRGAAGMAFRDGTGAPTGSLFGGAAVGPARFGAGLTAAGPHRIPGAADHRWTNVEALLGVWFAVPRGPVVGLAGGVGRRQYDDLDPVLRGTGAFELGWRAPLSDHWDLVPLARVDLDLGAGGLRRTTVVVNGETLGDLAPMAVRLELALSPHF